MARYMNMPQVKITLGTTAYTNAINMDVQVQRIENGFDTATVIIPDRYSDFYPGIVTNGTAIQIDVKDAAEAAYPTNPLFKGIVRFPVLVTDKEEKIILKCDGSGYGFGDTVVGQEYGNFSKWGSATDTATEILTNASHGIITKWVNKIMESATDSGFNYTTEIGLLLGNQIDWLYFPYKPCNKAIDDLCDLICAIRTYAADYGPHWIVTTDDVFHIKNLSEDLAGWHKYYNSATATSECKLYQGIDFINTDLEKIGKEANYVIYDGVWRRPSNGDTWTNGRAADWDTADALDTVEDDAVVYIVNDQSIKFTVEQVDDPQIFFYPGSQDAAWDFTVFSDTNVPSLNFYANRDVDELAVYLATDDANYFYRNLETFMPVANEWYHFSYPVGPYWNAKTGSEGFRWDEVGAPDWSEINYVAFASAIGIANETVNIDGLHFGDARICRIARDSLADITTAKLKVKVITDNIGKDDTLSSGTTGTTDTGLMARFAYAELLRCQTTALVGSVTVPMIKDVLPGQRFQIYAKKKPDGTYSINGTEMRATKINHNMSMGKFTTTISLTDDVTNSHPRPKYEEWNKTMAATRPEFQDRQASSLKAGNINISVLKLEEEY